MSDNDQSKPTGTTVSPRAWGAIVLALLVIAFIIQNRQDVEINLLFLTVGAPMWIVLSCMFLAGIVTAWLVARKRRS